MRASQFVTNCNNSSLFNCCHPEYHIPMETTKNIGGGKMASEENQVILTVVQKEIVKVENAIKREKAILKNIDDITATLEHIGELVEAGTAFPENSAYESYTDWQESAEKEIKSYNTSLGTIDKYRSLLAAYSFYVKNNTPEA